MALLAAVDVSIQKSEFEAAMKVLDRAKAADPECPAVLFKLGQCQEQMNKPRDAFKNYKLAADLAKKENDMNLSRKAQSAAEKLGQGLLQISEADQKLVVKLLPVADEAFDDEQYETARAAYQSILTVAPAHDKAREGLEKTEKALAARGDPVKAKIAAAMLAEVFYLAGSGKKDDAGKMAQDLVGRHGETAAGKEASGLLARSFAPPANLDAELAAAKLQLKEQQQKAVAAAKRAAAVKTTTTTTAPDKTYVVAAPPVDVDALERTAMEDAKKLPKDQLAPAFKDAYAKGTAAFANAKPGTEGNQKNLHAALEQFIRCEALYMRLEEEKLASAEIAQMQKQVGASRYSCMKMTILSH
jgi:hypothetical protein